MNAHIADPNVLDPAAQNPQNFELTPAAAPDTEDQEDLVLRFQKPYSFEGETYTEVDLSGWRTSRPPTCARWARW